MSEKLKIAPLVGSILLTLKHLTADLKGHGGPQASLVNSSLARFKLWSASSGASRVRGTRSLEYKLQEALSLRDHVISLLKNLWDTAYKARWSLTDDSSSDQDKEHPCLIDDDLAQYFSENNGPEMSALDEFLDDIKRIVDRLLRLSVVLKNHTPHKHFSPSSWDISKEDMLHVLGKFPGVPAHPGQRLALSLSIRRQWFRDREERFSQREEVLESDHTQGPNHFKPTMAAGSSISKRFKDQKKTAQQYDDVDDISEVNNTELRLPPIPKEFTKGPFKCPFCHSVVSLSNRQGWKRHVFGDLQPYVCLEFNCPTPKRLYARRSDWEQHMRVQHWKLWMCPFECSGPMHAVDEFKEHTTSKHKNEVSRHHLGSLLELCCVPDPTKACGRCILCNHQLASEKHYISHVASHLEQLALYALPLLEYDHDQDNDWFEEVDNQIDDDKSSSTNSESEQEQSDQDKVNADDNDEYAVYEESAGRKEDPKDLPAQSGVGKSFSMELLQGPARTVYQIYRPRRGKSFDMEISQRSATTVYSKYLSTKRVCEGYVDPQISKLLKDELGSYHGLVSGDLIRSREDHGDRLDFFETFGDGESLLEYKGIYVKAIGDMFCEVDDDVPRSSKMITSLHLLVCSDLPGGINIILKDNLENLWIYQDQVVLDRIQKQKN